MDNNAKLDSYFSLLTEIHDLFGYKEDWRAIPMDDCRADYWMLTNGEGAGSSCVWSSEPLTKESVEAGKTIYGGTIYTQRFLDKWVYRTDEFVMVSVDTHTDGNKFLMIFRADHECTDQKIRDAYVEFWAS